MTDNAIQRALEAAGVEFIAENGGGPGVRAVADETLQPLRLEPPTRAKAEVIRFLVYPACSDHARCA